jgi:hypothetical protein
MVLLIPGTVPLWFLLRSVWSVGLVLMWCLEAPVEQGLCEMDMEARYMGTNQPIAIADCRFQQP